MQPHPTRVLTIGCSCINRFQFDFFQERHPERSHQFVKSLFDWNIISLVGTESLLRLACDHRLGDALQDQSQFVVEWEVLLFNRQLPGVCFFHEQDIAKTFHDPLQKDILISKLTHQAAPFLEPDYMGKTHLIWSNVQPNLPDTVDNVTPWRDFQLTEQRYSNITALGRNLFGADTEFTFLATEDDVAREVVERQDVHVLSLPRGDDYQGPPDLFEAILSDIVVRTHT